MYVCRKIYMFFEIKRFKDIAEINSSGTLFFVMMKIEITEYVKLRC